MPRNPCRHCRNCSHCRHHSYVVKGVVGPDFLTSCWNFFFGRFQTPPPPLISIYGIFQSRAQVFGYDNHLYQLEMALQRCHRAFSALGLFPLPVFVRASLPPAHYLWHNRQSMTMMFLGALTLTTMHYHHMIVMLANFKECSRIATIMGYDLVTSIQPVLKLFEHHNKAEVLAHAACKCIDTPALWSAFPRFPAFPHCEHSAPLPVLS